MKELKMKNKNENPIPERVEGGIYTTRPSSILWKKKHADVWAGRSSQAATRPTVEGIEWYLSAVGDVIGRPCKTSNMHYLNLSEFDFAMSSSLVIFFFT